MKNSLRYIMFLTIITSTICIGCTNIVMDEQIIPATTGIPIPFSLDSYIGKKIFNTQDANSYIIKLGDKKKWDVGYDGIVVTVKEAFIERPREEIGSDIRRWIEGLVQDTLERFERYIESHKGTRWEMEGHTEIEIIVQLPNRKKIGRGYWSKATQKIKVELF